MNNNDQRKLSTENDFCGISMNSHIKKERYFSIISAIFVLLGILFLFLSAVAHEIFGVCNSLFFILALFTSFKAWGGKFRRTTFYTVISIATGFLGVLFLLLGRYVNEVFTYGNLVFYYASFLIGLLSLVSIIISGEIKRFSGILKIGLLVITAYILLMIIFNILEEVRHKKAVPVITKNSLKTY